TGHLDPNFARTTDEPPLSQHKWLSCLDNPMPDEVRACRSSRAPRGYVFHGPGVVPGPTLSSFRVENIDKLRPNFFEQTTEVCRADPSAGETTRCHGHDEVWKTCRRHFQRKMNIAVLRFKAQRIKEGSFFVLAQCASESR